MRKFYFKNNKGETFDLNATKGVMLCNVNGLGFSFGGNYCNMQSGFFVNTDPKTLPQQSIAGDIKTYNNAYGNFQNLINWLLEAQTLEFVYQPTQQKYFRKIEVQNISKGEIGAGGILTSPIVLNCLTPWYLENPTTVRISAEITESVKKYPYKYSYRYQQANAVCSIDVQAVGHMDSAFQIVFTGPAKNPVFTLTEKATGTIIGKMELDVTLDTGQQLIFNTGLNSKITIDGAEADSCIILSDIPSFFHLPLGILCTLKISAQTSVQSDAVLTIYSYYKGV